jgi:hypothetical protein
MLKKLLKPQSNNDKPIFPIHTEENSLQDVVSIDDVAMLMTKDNEFMEALAKLVTTNILDILIKKYNFEPSDKYKQEIEDKKIYINQLDSYLSERKQINIEVENDLQQFLQDTTSNINKALEVFSEVIKSRITEAEKQHGIDKIKATLSIGDSEHNV